MSSPLFAIYYINKPMPYNFDILNLAFLHMQQSRRLNDGLLNAGGADTESLLAF